MELLSHLPKGDLTVLITVAAGVLARYLPQLCYDLANRKRKVLVKKSSPVKAWNITALYLTIFATFLARAGCYPDSALALAGGIVIFAIGVAVGLAGLLKLNTQYCEVLVRHEGASLVTSGIYSVVRHPVRAGLFCELLGMVILSGVALLLVPLGAVIALQYVRTRDEEIMLKGFFGESEERYISRVPRFNFLLGLLRVCLLRWS